jgi:GTPase SAR1 family protein
MNYFPEPDYYDPTGGSDYRKQIVVDDQVCMLEIENIVASEGYTAMKALLLKCSDGVIIAYDICDRDSFEFAKEAWKEARLLRFEHEKTNASSPIPILLLGNKTDREAERVVSQDEGKALARRLCAEWAECSCRNRTGVDEAFHGLVRLMRQHIEKEEREKEEKRKLENPSAKNAKDGHMYRWKSQQSRWGWWKQTVIWRMVGSRSDVTKDTD